MWTSTVLFMCCLLFFFLVVWKCNTSKAIPACPGLIPAMTGKPKGQSCALHRGSRGMRRNWVQDPTFLVFLLGFSKLVDTSRAEPRPPVLGTARMWVKPKGFISGCSLLLSLPKLTHQSLRCFGFAFLLAVSALNNFWSDAGANR